MLQQKLGVIKIYGQETHSIKCSPIQTTYYVNGKHKQHKKLTKNTQNSKSIVRKRNSVPHASFSDRLVTELMVYFLIHSTKHKRDRKRKPQQKVFKMHRNTCNSVFKKGSFEKIENR